MDAKTQALRMLEQHAPSDARRVALETSMNFKPGSEGRGFWLAVVEVLSDVAPLKVGEPMYRGSALKDIENISLRETDEKRFRKFHH